MSKNYHEHLKWMLDECLYLEQMIVSGISYENLVENETLKRALVKSLENIGEAAGKIPFEIRENWKSIPWKDMIGMRQRLAHDYWGVNFEFVWATIIHKVPELK